MRELGVLLFKRLCKRVNTRFMSGDGHIVLVIFLIAFGLRFGMLMATLDQAPLADIAAHPSDSPEYIQLAEDFARFDLTHENILYMVGFGYALFLTSVFLLSGHSLLFALIVQILLGSLATVLIYKITLRLLKRPFVAVVAALINATSFTSMILSISFLSDTAFFFLLALSVHLFLESLKKPKLGRLLLMAALIALAAVTRSVGQFLPLLFAIVALLTPARYFSESKTRGVAYIGVTMALALMLISVWALRNYSVHNTFTVAGTGIEAAGKYLGARVAANISDSLTTADYQAIFNREMTDNGRLTLTPRQRHDWYFNKLTELFRADPILFGKTYLSIIGYNILAYDDNYHYRLPDYRPQLGWCINLCRKLGINVIFFFITMSGLAILIYRKQVDAGILLGALYLYFAIPSGFTFWQGSRIFYPAQLAGAVFIAIVLELFWSGLAQRIRR